ncbi:unnamed protein product [Pipistrellus nathusii]|uniref:Complex 1 LYR protein domain-containing protein n=1 Tax=Pipistrellus nathusii TaxID=59473 RepID=A0ABN9ZL61_PIPNA
MSRPSRLQRQVLSLYRELLRAGRGKPGAEARVRAEFRQHACLPRSDVLRIEYLYRRGRRQLQLLRSGHAKTLDAFERRQGANEEPGEAGASTTRPQENDDSRNPLEWSHRKSRRMDGDRPKSSDGAGERWGGIA